MLSLSEAGEKPNQVIRSLVNKKESTSKKTSQNTLGSSVRQLWEDLDADYEEVQGDLEIVCWSLYGGFTVCF